MSSTKTQIEWTDSTWSPVRGCSRVITMDRGRGVAEGEGSYDGLLAKGDQS